MHKLHCNCIYVFHCFLSTYLSSLGCAGVVVGHPLDTVKILLQTQDAKNPKYGGTLDCFKSLLAREGVRGLYKGMSSPLSGIAVINAIIFGVYGNTQRHLPNPDSLKSYFLAGSVAGFCQSFFCSPMELAKSRVQVSSESKTPFECLKTIYNNHGLKGVFRGLNMTIAREVPAFGTYFWTYEFLTRDEDSSSPISTSSMMLAGGTAGALSWFVIYPIDVLKSRMQIDDAKYKNSIDCLRKSISAEGYGFLYRGLAPTILRAFPVNAATFTVVTWTIRLFSENNFGADSLWGRCTDALYSLKVSKTTAHI